MHPNSNANRHHQKQRQRHLKNNRICIHLNTTPPALGMKCPRTHSDNVPAPLFGSQMRCSRCDELGAAAIAAGQVPWRPMAGPRLSAERCRALELLAKRPAWRQRRAARARLWLLPQAAGRAGRWLAAAEGEG